MEHHEPKADTVALVGFSRTTRDLCPFDNPDIEIWTMGRAWMDKGPSGTDPEWLKRWDVLFEVHPLQFILFDYPGAKTRNDIHFEFLTQDHGDKTIYMQEKYPFFPNAMVYPLDTIVAKYGHYLTSSAAYMMALADHMGYKEIQLYGFEMGFTSEYADQKPSFARLIGRAEGSGKKVFLPEQSRLLWAPLYAYEEMAQPVRTNMEQRIDYLRKEVLGEHGKTQYDVGRMEELQALQKEIASKIQALKKTNHMHETKINSLRFAGQELGTMLQLQRVANASQANLKEGADYEFYPIIPSEEGAGDVPEVPKPESPRPE